jgi:hypothetical protein
VKIATFAKRQNVSGQFKKRRQINEIKEPMTLCIAWKNRNTIEFWSDSRISFDNGSHVDLAVKVVKIPINLYKINEDSPTYKFDWGLCFAGGTNTIYYIKDFIFENLLRLEYFDSKVDVSAELIIDYVKKIYQIACSKYILTLQKQGVCQLIIGGYCPKENKIRVFKLSFIEFNSTDGIDEAVIETLELFGDDKNIEFIGSGKDKADDLYKEGLKTPNKILEKIIDENLVDTVGGQIQCGVFEYLNFDIKGYSYTKDNKTSYTLRGVETYDPKLFNSFNDLHPRLKYLVDLSKIGRNE